MSRLRMAVILAAICAVPAHAASLDVNFSDEAAQARYEQAFPAQGANEVNWNAQYMYNEDQGDVAGAGVHIAGDAGARQLRVTAGVGAELYWIDAEEVSADASALGLGGWVRAVPPDYNRLSFELRGHYAPKVLSFQDADGYYGVEARAGYDILRQAHAYVGYRRMRVSFEGISGETLDSGFHVGLQMTF